MSGGYPQLYERLVIGKKD